MRPTPWRQAPRPGQRALPGRLRAILLLAALGQGACTAGLLPQPAPAPVLLTWGDPPPAGGRAGGAAAPASAATLTLLVDLPLAASGHDTARMAYERTPRQLDYYARHQWVDTPARLLAPWLVQALQAGGGFAAVSPASGGVAADWRLQTEGLQVLHHVQGRGDTAAAVAPAASHVTIRLQAVLVEVRSRRVLATRLFEIRQAAPSEDAAGDAAATRLAAQAMAQAVAAFCARRAAGG